MSNLLSFAAGCFAPKWHPSLEALRQTMFARVADAQTSLCIFPEYAAMEAALIGAPDGDPDPMIWARRAADAHGDWVSICRDAAHKFECFILAGSGAVCINGKFMNRAVFCAPDGSTAYQDKMIPTPGERQDMKMVGGDHLVLFDTPLGKIGVSICYDAEFPLFSRGLAAAGAEMILVPSCTDTQAGQDRVQIAARARALENQCLVIHSPMIGAVEGCDYLSRCVGRAGMYGPPDWYQPAGGIHALAHTDSDQWVRHAINVGDIAASRTSGDVEVFNDWSAQGVPDLPVKIVTLGK